MTSTQPAIPHAPEDKPKDEVALNEISFNFTSYLQTFMSESNYDYQETEVFSNTFLSFMHSTLFHLTNLLISLKSSLGQEINNQEKECLNEIYRHNPLPEIGIKINRASKLMKMELPLKIKQCMIDAKYEPCETMDDHEAYISMVSTVLISETGKFMRFKDRFKYAGNDTTIPSPDCKRQKVEHQEALELNPASLKLISTSKKHDVYHLPCENTIMKVLKTSTVKDIKVLDNELEFGKTFYHPSIRQSLERRVFQDTQVLLLEYAPGVPICQLVNLDVKKFLILAREITSPLLAIHSNNLMHMNLSSDHIIYNPQTSSIKLISTGSCTPFGNDRNYISKQDNKDLRVISPEQTGRINRYIDYRSDFYSLGIVFYRLLTGMYPFESGDTLNLLHLHISYNAVPAHIVNPDVPVVVSEMVSKLMQKNAEDRYQSTKGIVHDLDLMIQEIDVDCNLSSIVLVQHDLSGMLMVPQKLYGRSEEYETLLSVFNRIDTSFQLVMLSGESGTGKTALVFELYKVVARRDGMLISGKYHFSKTEPYSALLTAFNNFCDDLLLKDNATILNCKKQISNAVGQEGGILTSVITNLDLVIGQQPTILDSFGQGSKTAKNRFHYVFVKLIKAICSVGFPIVLVLEDLQWMDLESLSLLSTLVVDKTIKNLMFIGTYRQNDTRTVNTLLEDLQKSENTVTQLNLNNFNHETLNELLSDALCIPSHEAYALTAFIHEKTQGNPFFAKQLIKTLSEQGLIYLNNGSWKWDASIFGANDISGSVLGLLRLKIQALDENTQQALKVASCLGCSFSLETVKLIVNRTDGIECALSTGLIAQQNGNEKVYSFVQDQVQAAAFSLLPEDPRRIFYYVGKKLWNLYSNEELNENIFVIIHLLYYAKDLITDQQERFRVAELFLLAGNRAITSTAFHQAFEFLEVGIAMLGANCWEDEYELSLKMYDAAAKSAYCISNYASLETYIKAILENAACALDTVQTYSLQIRFYNDNRKFQDAFDTAVCILYKIGENANYAQSEAEIDSEVKKTKLLLSSKSHEEISEMKKMQDESKLAIMTILSDVLTSLHFHNPQMYCLVSLRMVHLTLECGISRFSCLGFIALGSALCAKSNNMKDEFPYQLGKLAIMLLDKVYVKEFVPWVYGPFYALINPFYASIHQSVKPYLKLFKVSLEIGSNLGSIVIASTYCTLAFVSSQNLEKLNDDFAELGDIIPLKPLPYLATHQAVFNLLGNNTENPQLLSGSVFDYRCCYVSSVEPTYKARILILSAMVAYFFNDYTSSLNFVKDLIPLKKYISNEYQYPMMLFFEGLVSLAIAQSEKDNEILIEVAQKNIAELKNMSNNAPQNYMNKLVLLEAELAVVRNDLPKAMAYFKEAIILSRKNGFLYEEGIACERQGLFLLESNPREAAMLLMSAYTCYEKWGAKALLQKLKKKHPTIFKSVKIQNESIDLQIDESECSVSVLTEMSFASNNSKKKRVSFKI